MKIEQRQIPKNYQIDPDLPDILNKIYASRNIKSPDEINFELKLLIPYQQLKNTDKAAERLFEALEKNQRITIIGDFDADGATSTAVAIKALHLFGFKALQFLVPSRFKQGYGLTQKIVEIAHQTQKPDLIITVDNGVSSLDGVKFANQLGIDVLITDHHLAGQKIPAACVIVNPNMQDDSFPSKALAGVGVIFYVMLALRGLLREKGWFENKIMPNMAELLDLVALGTVADVVALDKNNRILVSQGLRRIKAGACCAGITALLKIARKKPAYISTSDLGFAVAPRLNAAGRLESMSLGIECLLETDPKKARKLALQLHELNQSRQDIEQTMREQALKYIEYLELETRENLPFGLSLYHPNWHQGVIGIVASRIKDRYHRPVIAFALGENNELKGSCRSIQGVHIRDILEQISTKNPDLILKFGGHAMAAGLSLLKENYDKFIAEFDDAVKTALNAKLLTATLITDGTLENNQITIQTANLLRNAAPWGQLFPAPLFEGEFEVIQQRILVDKHIKMVLKPVNGSIWIDAIAFNQATDHPEPLENIYIVYKMDINEYKGNIKLQFIIDYIQKEILTPNHL